MILKNIKRLAFGGLALVSMAGLSSCNGWLGEPSPGSTELDDFFTSGEACLQTVNGCYTPLAWEYNNTYFSEWYIGDIASDDALKGGQNVADGSDAYDIDNFKTNANNTILLDYYRAKFQGIIRCNLALEKIGNYELDETLSEELKNRYLGEAYFLRGLYYFQLVRVFGGVPLIDEVLDSADKWAQSRASVEETYAHIVSDFETAEALLWNKSRYTDEDAGRATRGAAQAYLVKAHLYNHNYDEAYRWGKKFMEDQAAEYSLFSDYSQNFTLAGENGVESIFEIQYMAEPTSDYGQGNGFTRGAFTTILTRPRQTNNGETGWGFDHPTHNLYAEFEAGDPRRDFTIGTPDDEYLDHVEVNYLGTPYFNKKTSYCEDGFFPTLDHASRSPFNYRLMRLSDVMLMYAEAALESGKDLGVAKTMLEAVRSRARAQANEPNALPAFPGYLGFTDNAESLRQAIRHERRVELAMEGHRWFDLVRWGIAYQVMDKDNGSYGSTERPEARAEMASFVPGKHELFPIPSEEINLNPMPQNPGY